MTDFEMFKKNANKSYVSFQANEDYMFVNNDQLEELLQDIEFDGERYIKDIAIGDSRYVTIPTESMADFLGVDKEEFISFLKEIIHYFPN